MRRHFNRSIRLALKLAGPKRVYLCRFSGHLTSSPTNWQLRGRWPAHSSPEYPEAVTHRLKGKLREVGMAPGVQTITSEIKGVNYFFQFISTIASVIAVSSFGYITSSSIKI